MDTETRLSRIERTQAKILRLLEGRGLDRDEILTYDELMQREPGRFPTKRQVYQLVEVNPYLRVKKEGCAPMINYTLYKQSA